MEHQQRTGSFKLRGAHNKMSILSKSLKTKSGKMKTIVTASTGNHGLACLDAMSRYNVRGKIAVPETISQCKREKLTSLGADLVFHGTDCEQTEVAARAMASASETEEYVSPYNDAEIMAGQGTLGVEIMDQLPNIDYLFIAVGGGGLIAGVAAYIKNVKPEVVIVGCQPAASPVMYQSVLAGHIVEYPSTETLSEATAGGVEMEAVTYPLCRDLVDVWEVVSEEDIKWGMKYIWDVHQERVEGAAGMCVAAVRNIINDNKDDIRNKNVCVLLCGGNIDVEIHKKIVK